MPVIRPAGDGAEPLRLLLIEGNPQERRERAARRGVASSSDAYAAAILCRRPDAIVDVSCAADPGPWLREGVRFGDYDGVVVGGSSLHAYDNDFAVRNQIELLVAACEAGLPALGSCWGLQIASIGAGGRVGRSPMGREIGVARKIAKTAAGRAHPFLAGKPAAYDAICIHYDEVTALPDGATVLSGNAHTAVQAAVVPLGNSELWGVQYHPEYDLRTVTDLVALYGADMLAEGFYPDAAARAAHLADLHALIAMPDDAGLRWRLAIDGDVLDETRRHAEIEAWLAHVETLTGKVKRTNEAVNTV